MMTLLMTVCLIASPDTCKEERLPIAAETVLPMQCMNASIPMIARWSEGHSEWRVVRWRCQRGRNGQRV